ncbi:hypothetical protein BGZ49_007105 [Haplosporangium sp. Z 27]|nr:hypothetical protein BGZ49_007105 [Haplosporangium sp. Z 27]
MTLNSNVLSACNRVLSIPELVYSIAQFLRQIHLSQLRLTSKRFHNAFIPFITFGVSLDYYHTDRKAALETLANYGPLLKSLRVKTLRNESNLEAILVRHQSIQRVHFRCWGINQNLLLKILESQPKLNDLTIHLSGESGETFVSYLAEAIASKAPPLKTFTLCAQVKNLVLSWSILCFLLDSCPTIQHLHLIGFKILRKEDEKLQPQIQSLTVSDVSFSHADISFFLHTMSNIRSLNLRLYQSGADTFNVLMGDSDSSRNVLPQLTQLKIAARRNQLSGLTKFIRLCCPRIQDLELADECQYAQRADMLGLLDHFKRTGITLKRLAIDFIPESCVQDWVRRILEGCCPKLEELEIGGGMRFFTETQDYEYHWRKSEEYFMIDQSLKFWFPFASTLRKLHLKFMENNHCHSHANTYLMKQILRSMPLLEDLALMELLPGFDLLENLGRRPPLVRGDETHELKQLDEGKDLLKEQNWYMERPFLRVLKIGLQQSVGFKAEEWNRELVHRFRFLEELSVKTLLSHPMMILLGQWKETLRPGLEFSLLRLEERTS